MEGFIREGMSDLQSMADRALRYGGDSHYFDDSSSITPERVRDLLDSADELEKLKGMKWLLAMMSKGRDMSDSFSAVVKNVVVKSVEIKKMVYNYLVHYADYNSACREMALLSINSFQKDMSGSNQFIRGLALRVLTSIRVAEITQIQLLAVQKCAKDSSPYVRKCAATAITKIFAFDPSQLSQLKEILEGLLDDPSTMVLGSALATFNEVCPREYQLLHSNYRTICHLLADLDEWSQIIALEVLIRYTRNQFVDPTPGLQNAVRLQAKQRSQSAMLTQGRQLMQERLARQQGNGTQGSGGDHSAGTEASKTGTIVKRRTVRKAFYSDEEDISDEEEFYINEPGKPIASPESNKVESNGDAAIHLDIDHNLVLTSSMPLLKSRNCGVVLNVCTLQYYCGAQQPAVIAKVAKALVRILRNYREIQYVVLNAISIMARDIPSMFEPFLSEFFVKSTDPTFNKLLKLEIMTSVCSKSNVNTILRELQVYIKQPDVQLVCASIRAVGKVADCDPSTASLCMDGLLQIVVYNMQSGRSRYSSLGAGVGASGSTPSTTAVGSEAPTAPDDLIISDAITVLRHLIQQNSHQESASRMLLYLTKLLISEEGSITVPAARASVVWLIGEFHELVGKVAPDVLRILANKFVDEATETKNQILNFAVKLSLRFPNDSTIEKIMTYVLEMSRYDSDVDFRDRARLITAFLGLSPTTDLGGLNDIEQSLGVLSSNAVGIFLAKKLPPSTLLGAVDIDGVLNFNIGSLSSLVGHTVSGYEPIPDWQEEQPDSSVRDQATTTTGAISEKGSIGGGRGTADSLYSSDEEDRENKTGYGSSIGGKGAKKFMSSSESEESSSTDDSSSDDSGRRRNRRNQQRAGATGQKIGNDGNDSSGSGSNSNSDSDSDSSEEEFVSRPKATVSSIQNNSNSYVGNSRGNNSSIKASIRSSRGIGINRNANLIDNSSGVDSKTLSPTNGSNNSTLDLLNPQILSSSMRSIESNKKNSSSSSFDVFDDIAMFSNNNAGSSTPAIQDNIINSSSNVFLGLTSSPSTSSTFNNPSSPALSTPLIARNEQEILSPIKSIIRPELSRGISLGLAVRLGPGPRPSLAFDAISAMLVLKNGRDLPIKKIRISFPIDVKRTSIDDIAILNPNEERHIPIDMVVSAPSKSYRIDLSTENGSFSGTFSFYSFDLFYPLTTTLAEFNSTRQTLLRMSAIGECTKAIPTNSVAGLVNGDSIASLQIDRLELEVLRRLKRLLNAYLVQGPAGDGSRDILFAAASRRKGIAVEEKLLVTVKVAMSNVTIKVISEDSVMDTTLVDTLKGQLCNESLFTNSK